MFLNNYYYYYYNTNCTPKESAVLRCPAVQNATESRNASNRTSIFLERSNHRAHDRAEGLTLFDILPYIAVTQ